MRSFVSACVLAIGLGLWLPFVADAGQAASGPRDAYTGLLAREEVLRRDLDTQPEGAEAGPLLRRVRALVAEYERMSKAYPRSGYSDNALWQGALLEADAFTHFDQQFDRRAALRLLASMQARFPSSSLNKQAPPHRTRLEAAAPKRTPPKAVAPPSPVTPPPVESIALTAVRREVLPDGTRLTLELDRETAFHEERLDGPARVFVDLVGTRAADALQNAVLVYDEDVVRQVRIGDQPGGVTRVVFDLQDAGVYSIYPLYSPYRLVVDFQRLPPSATLSASAPPSTATSPPIPAVAPGVFPTEPSLPAPAAPLPVAANTPGASWSPPVRAPERDVPSPAVPVSPPSEPATNLTGGFSLSRQLGLGISRIVIDAGHGGHDPGAHVKGLNEADLVLDVALRLEQLLVAQPGVEVVMTRRSNVYVPLEERTAIANRASADLFLSIHANASPNAAARGIETYFLNLAPNPEAEALAARENAGAARTMTDLPGIVRAIALNNKIDESRDFATFVQKAMYDRLRKVNRQTKNLGVKQAPFMVLIGATMPSVLAEISFLTNKAEAVLLKTSTYRQGIAEAIFAGITTYQRSLKASATVAAQ